MDICDSGADDGLGCGLSFSNKTTHGLCAKCTKLAALEDGSVEYVNWQVCLSLF